MNLVKTNDLVRLLIVKTNPYRPFSILNKMPYYLAIKAFARLCKKLPQIRSVYLRHGLIKENWVPAISDIDLTVISDSNLTVEEEFDFLRSFWGSYHSMKKLFPMLGEVEVLNEEHVKSWTKFNIRGYESRNWGLIYGTETVKGEYVAAPVRLRIDSLNYSLLFYLNYFLKRFYKKEGPSYLISRETQRLVSKILQYANYDVQGGKNRKVDGRLDNKTDMIFRTLKGMEDSIKFLTPPDDEAGSRNNDKEWLTDIDSHNKVFFDDQALDTRALAPWDEAIESIILKEKNYSKRTFIIKDGLDASAMKSCIDAIRRVCVQEDTAPVIVSSCVFKYMLRHYRPFEYTNLVRHRTVAYGKDPLPDIRPPDKHSFINHLIGQTPTLLAFPQSHTLISPPSPDWFLGRELDSKVERALLLKFYLEKGVIKPWYHEFLGECEKHYPDDFEKLREIKKNEGCLREEALSRRAFRLLKGIANDIHKSISNSNVVDNLFKTDEICCE